MKNHKLHVIAYDWQPGNKQEIEAAMSSSSRITYENDPGTFRLKLGMENYDVIILGVKPNRSRKNKNLTFDMLKSLRHDLPSTPVIVISATDQPQLIVEAMREGASDFIVSPCLPERIVSSVERVVTVNSQAKELAYLRRTQDVVYSFEDVVAETPSFRQIVDNLRKFAAFDSSMLFTGEIGTGKGFLAGTVHFNSPRRHKPFITIKCTNTSELMLESELFGHEPDAFPGADKLRIGRLEQANGGTVYLDEIRDLPLDLQAKLLRLLEEKSFERLGSSRTIFTDVRVIAATKGPLADRIADGRFREDLFYRLNVLPVRLPPLKERPDCIEALARKLLRQISTHICKPMNGFTDEAIQLLTSYHWPGNIVQLSNLIERAIILEESDLITPESLRSPGELGLPWQADNEGIPELTDNEVTLVLRALRECNWVQKRAAQKLGITARVMNYKIQKFNISHPRWRRNKGA